MTRRVHMVIDTDAGVDDAAAIWWALDRSDVDVLALTTVWGNVGLAEATANACRILHAHGAIVPVAEGAGAPIGDAPLLRRADFIHGTDGLGDAGIPAAPFGAGPDGAVDVLRRVVDERPGEVTIVSLGPLTNIAACIEADPSWAQRVGSLVVMGGAIITPGNAQPAAEANVAHDPTAASIVVGADWPSPPLLVGLDATHRATLTGEEFAVLDARATAAAAFLAGPLAFYRRFGGTFCPPGEVPCHDLTAVMAAAIEDLFVVETLPLAVVTSPGPAWGATIADRRIPFFARAGAGAAQAMPDGFHPWRIALDVDVVRYRAQVRRFFGGS
jgi:purine nucleosidase